MLSNIINVDLHIHSKASAYKEEDGFVDNEITENLPVLFRALNEKNINHFSITDHNRFYNDNSLQVLYTYLIQKFLN